MDEAEARTRIWTLVDASSDPVVSDPELDLLVAAAKRVDGFGNLPTNIETAPTWQPSTGYLFGDVVTAAPAAGRWWMCITPGTSSATQPHWPDQSGKPPHDTTVSDGHVRWLDVGGSWAPTWDLNTAAAQGWELKAGKVAGRYQFTTDGQTFHRQQLLAHCRRMAADYRRKLIAGVP